MGLFDSVVNDGRRFQTKALGSWGNTFTVGDAASVKCTSQTEQEYALNRVHLYDDLPSSYTVEAWADGERIDVLISDGRIAAAVARPTEAHFDGHGRSIGAQSFDPVIVGDDDWIEQSAEARTAIAHILRRR